MTADDDGPDGTDGDFEGFGFLSLVDLRTVERDAGRVVLRIPYDESLANPPRPDGQRPLHGGLVATAVDVAGISAVGSAYDDGAGTTTVDLNVSYLRPATDDLLATGEVVRAGRSLGVARVSVESATPDGETVEVAAGRVSVRVWAD